MLYEVAVIDKKNDKMYNKFPGFLEKHTFMTFLSMNKHF